MPWLAWNWKRQTYENRELVLVDSNPPENTKANEALYDRDDVRFVRMPPGTGIGPKLQIALELAKGDFVMIWCDDDWQNPDRIHRSVKAAYRDDRDVVGWDMGFFLQLREPLRATRYECRGIRTSAAAALARMSVARKAHFEDERAEDTAWIRRVMAATTKDRIATLEPWPHSLWLVHGRNTEQRNYDHLWQPLDNFPGLLFLWASEYWGDTTNELRALRERLDACP